jgi:hypothetical protein
MGTTLWTVGRDRHFGQRGGPLGAVDAGSDITAYSLDWKANSVSWHLVPFEEAEMPLVWDAPVSNRARDQGLGSGDIAANVSEHPDAGDR